MKAYSSQKLFKVWKIVILAIWIKTYLEGIFLSIPVKSILKTNWMNYSMLFTLVLFCFLISELTTLSHPPFIDENFNDLRISISMLYKLQVAGYRTPTLSCRLQAIEHPLHGF
jgi:hypothetical protein